MIKDRVQDQTLPDNSKVIHHPLVKRLMVAGDNLLSLVIILHGKRHNILNDIDIHGEYVAALSFQVMNIDYHAKKRARFVLI